MNDIRIQRLMRELVGGEEGKMPPVDSILRIAGIAVMLFAIFLAGNGPA